jgi:hypothetical protein
VYTFGRLILDNHPIILFPAFSMSTSRWLAGKRPESQMAFKDANPSNIRTWHRTRYARIYRNIDDALAFCRSLDARPSGAERDGGEAREAATGQPHLAPQASLGLDELAALIQDGQTLQPVHDPPQPAGDIAHLQSTLQGHIAAAASLRFSDSRVARHPNGNFDIHIASSNDSANEDGAGSMLVAPSRELQHNVSAHNDTSRPLSPAFTQRDLDMQVATANATATSVQDAPALTAPDALPMPDASADQDMTSLDNGLPLTHATPFPQHIDLNGPGMGEDFPGVGYEAMDLLPVASDERLTAFARLRFDDGSYYMHTYQIILGRNIDLAHRDMRRLAKVDQLKAEGHREAAEDLLKGTKGKKHKRHAARSVISEKGGIVNAPIKALSAQPPIPPATLAKRSLRREPRRT